jgi:hypothetical protein
MATVDVIKRQSLELLGRLRLGQTFQSQDDAAMLESYNEVYADLKETGLATWGDDVPDKLVPHVVSLVAMNRVDVYGVSDSRYERIAARASKAKREISLLTTPAHESIEEPDDY